MKVNGEEILRFRQYDPTGELQDVLVQHDNYEEIALEKMSRIEALKAADLAAMQAARDAQAKADAEAAAAAEAERLAKEAAKATKAGK